MASAFKKGDLVVLKSGGPTMTIDEVPLNGVWAVWFAGAKRERAHFQHESLEPAPKKPESKK